MLWIAGADTVAAERGRRDIEEFKTIVLFLIEQSDAEHPLGARRRLQENLHLHPEYPDTGLDARRLLLGEFAEMLMRAARLQNAVGGTRACLIIIGGFSGPQMGRDNFTVHFGSEHYFALVDILSDFTGIPEYMLAIRAYPTFCGGPWGSCWSYPCVRFADNHLEVVRVLPCLWGS